MTHRQPFQDIAAEFGGAFDIAELSKFPLLRFIATRRRELETHEQRHFELSERAGRARRLQIGYAYNLEFNARATVRDDVDVIIVNAGVPMRLAVIVHAFIVSAWIENRPATITQHEAINGAVDLSQLPDLPPPLQSLFNALHSYAERFVLAHELAHITNGHVDWVRRSGLQGIEELRMAGNSGISGLDRQTLEWNADCSATADLINHAASLGGLNIEELKLAMTGAYICARVFAPTADDTSVEQMLEAEHPPGFVRMQNMLYYALMILEQRGWTPEEMMPITQCAAAAEQSWSNTFDVPSFAYHDESLVARGAALVRQFSRRWTTFRTELNEFKRYGELMIITEP